VVVSDGETCGDALGEAAEAASDALADWLQRLEAGGVERGVEADALGPEQWSMATNTAA
jgi:hypothetical protein